MENYQTVIDEHPLENNHFNGDLVACGPKPSSSFAVTQLILSVMSSKHVFDSVPLCARVFCCGIEDIEFLQDFIPPKVPIRKPFSATPFSITVSLKHKSLFESMTCITRQFRFAYALRTKLADPAFVKEAEELSINMTTKRFTDEIIKQIKDHPREASEYGADTGQVRLLTECNFKVLLIA